MKTKKFSDEMLKKYISSEISIINEKRKDEKQWKRNEEFHSQVTIRMEEGEQDVSKIANGEL
jgi:hypothetical protein